MMNEDFHKPFIKGMIIVGMITLITMISTKFFVECYMTASYNNSNSTIYTSSSSASQDK